MWTWDSYVEGPRWAGFGTALKKACMEFELTLEKLEVHKGWIRETTFFTISSESKEKLEAFQQAVLESLKEYNR